MKIDRIDIYKFDIPRKHPLKTPLGIVVALHNIAVKVAVDDGLVGWGEGSGFAPITGDDQSVGFHTAAPIARMIFGKDPTAFAARAADINSITIGSPSIRAAFDMALYDIAAQCAGMPLYRFLGGQRRELRTDMTIGMQETVAETVARAERVLADGFDAIKLKVGRPGLADVDHVKAVRETAGDDVSVRIDSNQGWDYPSAAANLDSMADLDLQYSEQPLPAWDIAGLARLRDRARLPICVDESLFTDKDALKLVHAGAADYFNIKLMKAGGIFTSEKINTIAEAAGAKCMIGCFSESRLGLSTAAHLAMARPNIVFLDLDSAYDLEEDPVIGGVAYDEKVGGLLRLSDKPGLGASLDEGFLQRCDHVAVTEGADS